MWTRFKRWFSKKRDQHVFRPYYSQENQRTCRICLEESYIEPNSTNHDFIAPCQCTGSVSWVHRSCLDSWRATNPKHFTMCEICQFTYELNYLSQESTYWQSLYWGFRMVLDTLLMAIGFFAFFMLITGLVYTFDYQSAIPAYFSMVNDIFAAYLLAGILLSMSIIGIVGIATMMTRSNNNNSTTCIVCENSSSGAFMFWLVLFAIIGTVFSILFMIQFFVWRWKSNSEIVWRFTETQRIQVKDLSLNNPIMETATSSSSDDNHHDNISTATIMV